MGLIIVIHIIVIRLLIIFISLTTAIILTVTGLIITEIGLIIITDTGTEATVGEAVVIGEVIEVLVDEVGTDTKIIWIIVQPHVLP